MIQVVIIGGGNLAFHLSNVMLKTANVDLVQIYNRSIETIKPFEYKVAITDDLQKLKKAAIYIICVSDKAIESIAKQISKLNALVVHTSGSTGMDILKSCKRQGVFYPLQTFSKERAVKFSEIPICLESNNSSDLTLLTNLAKNISENINFINSKQREQLHIAAVFVNNFVNYMYHIGDDICKKNEIDFTILQALIAETAKKVAQFSPYKAQTGPAKRGDVITTEKHLKILTNNQREIYKLLSHSIASVYGKKL